MPTRAEVDAQARALEAISLRAQRAAVGLWASLDTNAPEASAAAFREALPEVLGEFGDIAANLAADFYDTTRDEARVPSRFRAVTAQPPLEAAEGTAARLAGHLFGDPAEALPGLRSAADRLVKQPYRDTIAGSAARDPARPRWARVPRGVVTCEFCLMLASRGFVYRSEESAKRKGGGGSYHGHCDCVPVASFDTSNPALDGYDPDALYVQWKTGVAPQADEFAQMVRDAGLTDVKRLADTSPESALKANPLYATDPEARINCQKCTLSYEMRRRGLDVTAQPSMGPNRYGADNDRYFEGVDAARTRVDLGTTTRGSRRQLEDAVRDNYPEGARGSITVLWKGSGGRTRGGHIFNWENTPDGVRWLDAQPGREYAADDTMWRHIHRDSPVYLVRLDHLKLKPYAATQVTPG